MKQENTFSTAEFQDSYSEDGFFSKISDVFKKAGLKVVYMALLLYYVLIDENTPTSYKAMILGALAYFISPLDFIPDILPVVGYTDDAAALMGCIGAVSASITPEIKKKAKSRLEDWFGEVDNSKLDEVDEHDSI